MGSWWRGGGGGRPLKGPPRKKASIFTYPANNARFDHTGFVALTNARGFEKTIGLSFKPFKGPSTSNFFSL
uniref:Uncharacterized protein n=1 Tax=Romanomermis culicivorax TaxID=13658 RepID=A0A915IET3_ROMCU